MQRRISYWGLALLLAFVLVLGFAGVAQAATPASDGAGQTFGLHHAEHAQMGMLGQGMNPGMHRGFYGWTGP